MASGYFHLLTKQTPTRLWINNPSGDDLVKAIDAGAISCTTNPAYCSKLIKSDPGYLHEVIDKVIWKTSDVEEAAILVYQEVSARVMKAFLPLYEESGGRCGFVTMQDDPRKDEDTEAVIEAAKRNRKLGKNFMAKIPVIKGGVEALMWCVAENIPICATEVFAISQAIYMCELYNEAVKKTGNRPPFYMTHITGIFDEYLKKTAKRVGIEVSPEVLAQAGCAVGRKEYHLLKERGYDTVMLGGGARGLEHFTEFVGGDVHITINWSTAQELIEAETPIENRIDVETPQRVIDELSEKFPDFERAYADDGLAVEEFAGYGPVQLFRNSFLNGYYLLLAEIAQRRHLHAL